MLITPEYVFKDVTHITPEWLAAKGITALVLDIDNTLTADPLHRNQFASPLCCESNYNNAYFICQAVFYKFLYNFSIFAYTCKRETSESR